jgi:hypothetical protein
MDALQQNLKNNQVGNQTMGHGGVRQGAGRRRGTPNKASAARQAEVAASGITPLEVMLKNMRAADSRATELEKQLDQLPMEELEPRLQLLGEIVRQRQVAQDCAKDAVNYVHPKLNDPDHPLIISDTERAEAVIALLRKGGIDLK